MSNNKAFKVKNGLELQEYAKSISDTAVDVFVYDTRKDSDGGAWRKRTQHTSWYNETLNTATRGSRKEFPAVAVIVAESGQVTIYDGDDPDLPMWMVFEGDSSSNLIQASTQTSISCSNGVLVFGSDGNLHTVKLLSDISYADTSTGRYPYIGNIEQRNDASSFATQDATLRIVSSVVNDVAMTVLPNAPIDAATGLPVPTIAVATDGGISVITDSGAVYDVTESSGPDSTHAIEFTDDNKIVFMWSDTSGINDYPHIGVMPIPSSDQSSSYYYSSTFIEEDYSYNSAFANSNEGPVVVPSAANTRDFKALARNKSCGYDSGLAHIYSNPSDARRSMVAYTTSSYNTGWMNGDIKLATLSDTDDTNVTGSELVTNGTFDTDTDWTKGTGWSITGGQAVGVCSTAGTASWLEQQITTVVGKKYVLSFELVAKSGISGNEARVLVPGQVIDIGDYAVGYHAIQFTADSTISNPQFGFSTAADNGDSFTIDNVSIRLAEEDRSVNGNGLQVFGTVTKSAVATGADLVAYSGFSASNYLEQPYNADLDFGTGDFCIMGWNKGTDTAGYLIARNDGSGSTDRIAVDVSSSKYRFYLEAGATGILTSTSDANTNTWTQFCALRRSGAIELYINGKLEASGTSTVDLDNSSCVLHIGDVPHVGNAYTGSLALFRISATAPTPEQIKKIYEDEKFLFQDGAQATLYGASDAVTALAYDDTTELLHVGTSAGRSVFQGLRRVDNTTTAVGAAISASNGLVAED